MLRSATCLVFALSLVSTNAFSQAKARETGSTTQKSLAQTGVITAGTGRSASQDGEDPTVLRLSLSEAINRAVSGNLGVEIQRFDYRITGYSAKRAYGVFDPEAFLELLTASSQNPVASTFQSAETDRIVVNGGVRQFIPTGGRYTLGVDNSRQASNNIFSTVNPAYNAGLNFGLEQPLLRNFGIDVNRRGINIARNNLGINKELFRTVLMQTTLAVEQAYLDLIFARENLEVVNQSLVLARDQERITSIRIDVGASAPLDILQPRVAIATREEQRISAEAQVRSAEDRLRQLMNLPVSEWDRPILPVDAISYEARTIDVAGAVARALELRPEIRQVQYNTENSRIDYHFARNQVLPRVDLAVNYGLGGLGGNRIIRDPITNQPVGVNQGGFGDALSQVTGFEFPSWSLGLTVGVPITNIGARSERKRAELNLERSETDAERVRQNISIEVRQAARNIDTLAQQIVATRAAREAAEKNVDAERRRYENGMTTNFNVLLIQQELSDARSRELAALVRYNQAVAEYHRAVGDLLEVRNIAVEEPEQFDLPRDRFEDVKWLNYGHYADRKK